ncbi:hypothetical protein NBT05_06065 [Aquimarina sp. ERC-38]|uniref:hypothetical protein n=1 Tax=Aquimarina sp. ERC-38 TaxID=2949996 RepID=UPI00224805D4|nr:hypothetical protein [Aquimarina sp. ERC-38]UZO82032.1 hypothetical protein NBT05_06065 [Aquimarina sp. ERC-38]
MKKCILLLLLLCSIFFFNCSDSDDETQFFFERVPIESVELPEQLIRDKEVTLKVLYQRPSDCHSFNNFDYETNANQRTVTVINIVVESDSICKGLSEKDIVELPLNFVAGNENSYVFKFWIGQNEEGEDTFETIEIPVVKE